MNNYDRKQENKAFFKLLAVTVLPLLVQSIFTQCINFIDQIMVSSLGTEAIAAIGASNKLLSLYNSFLYGSGSGCAMFLAQYWGARDHESFRKILGVLLTITLSIGALFSALVLAMPTQLIMIFVDDPIVIDLGVKYMRAVVPAYFMMSIIFPLEYMLRSMNKVKITMIESVISVLINCFANYVFIYGKFGCPKLGVIGAALGTVLCRAASILGLLIYIVVSKNEIMRDPKKLFAFDMYYVKAFFRRAVPLIGNEMMWNLGTTIYFIIYGRAGTDALAAMSIMQTLQMLAKIASGGFCGASTIIIGNEIGNGDLDKVKRYCDKFRVTAFFVGLFSAMMVMIIRIPILYAYSIQGTVVGEYVSNCMLVLSLYIFINCNNNILVEGIFRSGGDIMYLTIMDMGSIWLVGMPLTVLAGVLHLHVVIIYAAYIALELYKVPLGFVRYKSGKWLHLLYKEKELQTV